MATMEEVKEFVRSHNVFPRQLYTVDDLKNDREFGPLLQAGEAAIAKVATLTAEKADIEKKSSEAIKANEKATAKDRFTKLIPEGATDKQKAFYLRRFDPSRLEKLDDDALKAHLDAESKEFAEEAKLFGVTEDVTIKPGEIDTSASKTDPVDAALKETVGGKA